jgi:predicted MFS family arabinose efflux permease
MTAKNPVGRMSRAMTLLFAIACGASVANIYFAHPLLDEIAGDLSVDQARIGIVVTMTQVGYGLGLLLIVPLGDLIDRRRLVVGQMILSAVALTVVGIAPSEPVMLIGMATIGLLAVVVQVVVAFAASLAAPHERGHVVGLVTSGVVIGILLARFIAGLLADLGGWRLVYLAAAISTLTLAGLLYRAMPTGTPQASSSSYGALMRSMFVLFRDEPLLRARAVLACLIFAALNVLWTPLVLPLAAPPFSFSHTEIGMFGLAGVAGALAAGRAGGLADRGLGQTTTGLALALLTASWIPIALLGTSIWLLLAGIVMLDLAIQAVHVTSQSLIFSLHEEARSRIVGCYMLFYSIGSAAGSIASTLVYAHAGWSGVCMLGALISMSALCFWALTLRYSRARRKLVLEV